MISQIEKRRSLFANGGEMAARMQAFDWSKSSLGPAESWPQSLRTAIRIMLTSKFAMWMAWGPELIFFCNDAYLPTVGLKRDWVLGARSDKVWEEIWPDIGPRIGSVLNTGQATWDESLLLFLERSGFPEETYHTFSYSPLDDDDGQITGMLCVVTEITDRIIGERRLATLRDLGVRLAGIRTKSDVLAALTASIGAQTRDLPFLLTYLLDEDRSNLRLASCIGLVPGTQFAPETVARDDDRAIWPAAAALGPDFTDNHIDVSGLSVASQHLPDPCTNALVVPISSQGQAESVGIVVAGLIPYRPFDASYSGFIGLLVGQIAAGLAGANAYEQERKRADALAEIDRAKTTFFSNVSHEFRTPLTLMLGTIEDLKQRLAVPGAQVADLDTEQINLAHRNSLRLLKLVNTLLDFARIEAGRVEACYVATELSQFTVELASAFQPATEKAGLRLIIDCPVLAERAFVDRDMWEKVVLNLMSNAFKFTLEGEIEVKLRLEGAHFVLVVRDTGVGIPAADIDKVFDRFHRVLGTEGRTHEGSGIGLALVQELVRLHGGTAMVESRHGTGAAFRISIPVGTAHLPSGLVVAAKISPRRIDATHPFVEEALRWLPNAAPLPESLDILAEVPVGRTALPSDQKQVRILVADDNADMRSYLARILSDRWTVDLASNGIEALAVARARQPDLILSDVMMPGLDGFSLVRTIRSDEELKTLPVILLSARAGEEARIEGLGSGADDYLIKPFSARELIARIDAHITLAKVRRDAELRQRLMTNELNHRVKNTLAVVQAIATQTARYTQEPKQFNNAFQGRITALARVHDILTKTHWTGSSLYDLATSTLAPFFEQNSGAVRVAGPHVPLEVSAALSLSLALNELATNATKYGALLNDTGYVTLDWSISGQPSLVTLQWVEHGGPAVVPPTRTGFGYRLINTLSSQLAGSVNLAYPPEGVRCEIKMPFVAA